MTAREAKVEHELWRLLKNVLEKRGYRVNGVQFGDVEPEYPVDKRRADLVLTLADGKPILVIEVKRKVERVVAGTITRRVERRIDPVSREVIDQALWYAVHAGAPFFATTNGRVFALFRVPEPGEGFSIERHRILLEEITLNEAFAEELLELIAKLHRKEPVAITPLDWTFIVRLRSFVNWLADVVRPLLREKLELDAAFREKYEELAREVGYRPSVDQLAKEMAYIFMNKIVFYKILERYYPELGKRKLKAITAPDAETYLRIVESFFARAVQVTENFEPVFFTGIYDEISIPDDELVFETINAFIEDMDRYRLEELGSDVVGFIYEELIPAAERHQLGHFYTPPDIAEFIVRWAVRKPGDLVLDPGCGSGTFLVKAYRRLLELKGYRAPTEKAHREVLSQLYAIDINPFPLHLTALNLASRYIRAPSTEVNTILSDFFRVRPQQVVLATYVIKTPAGEVKREIRLPVFDAVVGNPPYTRWTEIPERTKEAIQRALGDLISRYSLTAQIARGREPGIYVHFIMWAHKFLKPGGRLGMIISDSWLQTDYGVDFGRFLLENFKVKALIDISARVFPVPLIGTCILLLEKPEEGENVDDNRVVFIYLSVPEGGLFDVDELLRVVEEPEKAPPRYVIRVMRQGDVPRDQKWINFIFRPEDVLKELEQKTIRMGELFEPSRGNYGYAIWALKHGRRPDIGAKNFFYLTEDRARALGLMDYVYPAITSARYAKWFTFTKEDWEALRERGSPCYFFMCHKPREELPEHVREYIRWGEPVCPKCGSEDIEPVEPPEFRCRDCGARFEKCVTQIIRTRGGGRICSQALACRERERRRERFYGWYDLGGVVEAPIMAVSQARYKTRFFWCQYPLVTYDRIIAFIPRVELAEPQLKALLAYLNSSFAQLYIEAVGRTTGAVGPIALEVSQAREMPVIDPRELDEKTLEELAALFDKLERRARELGGADRRENIMELWDTVIAEIDAKVAEILGLPEDMAVKARELAKSMMERRLTRAEEARPRIIKGEEAPRLARPRRARASDNPARGVPLDAFM